MSRVRYTADVHFNHPNQALRRGFTMLRPDGTLRGNVEEHDGIVTENLNKGASKDDILIIAGDFALNWKGIEAKLAALISRVILIEGNHDKMSSVHQNAWKHQAAWIGEGKFEAITAYMKRKAGNREFLVSHYPYSGDYSGEDRFSQYRLRDEGMWLVHGHTHSKEKITPLPPAECMFCGAEMTKRTCEDQYKGTDLEGQGCSRLVSRQIHVGLDAWDLRPVSEDDVITLMRDADLANSLDTAPGR